MARYSGGTVLVQSDAAGAAITGLGTSGAPITLTGALSGNSQTGYTDVRDFTDVGWMIYVTEKGSGGAGTATKITLLVHWAMKDAPATADEGQQLVEKVDTTGTPPVITVLSETTGLVEIPIPAAAVTVAVPYTLPVFFPKVRIAGIMADIIGSTPPTAYVEVYRKSR